MDVSRSLADCFVLSGVAKFSTLLVGKRRALCCDLGTNDTSSSLHPTSSDSMEKVAMRERIVVGEEATGGAEGDECAAPEGSDAAEEGNAAENSGEAALDAVGDMVWHSR